LRARPFEGLNARDVAAPETTQRAPQGPPRSSDDLLRALVGGEVRAHVALYEALLPSVVGALQRILRDPSRDYEDLVQATFERIVRILVRDKKPPAENLSGWAAAIATHVALDALRARIRERRVFSRDEADRAEEGADVEERLEAKRELLVLQGHLARMKPDHAQALLLHDVLGHDLAETAAITGVSLAAAQKRLWRGRQELARRTRRAGDAR
jgi:RNA polymerase sigma-70 factor, ECF subfamily